MDSSDYYLRDVAKRLGAVITGELDGCRPTVLHICVLLTGSADGNSVATLVSDVEPSAAVRCLRNFADQLEDGLRASGKG